ncbi:MAG: phosphoadenylyl-sulfate reductase [Chloroherpetonaceae bacterium]|nr:phosphoadenylyl-sulfate reductase [Chthonomonadaceae bacterium]MDW8207915.1 phosphoadenylyl-sulfate reductase [Chloroherpetonaceae bacterium]
MASPTPETLRGVSAMLEEKSPEEILRWAVAQYYPRLTMATAFGAEGCVLLAMLAAIEPRVRVFNLDTGYQFPETLELRERIRARYGIDVELVRPEETVEEMERRLGGPIYGTDPDACCRMRKIEPLRRALAGYDAWITAIRRDQTPDRARAGIVEWDSKFQLVKINPLANWTRKDVWAYIYVNEVPYNPLHDRGYLSIGCWPCTRPVQPGEDERAGRWANFAKLECGLHTR